MVSYSLSNNKNEWAISFYQMLSYNSNWSGTGFQPGNNAIFQIFILILINLFYTKMFIYFLTSLYVIHDVSLINRDGCEAEWIILRSTITEQFAIEAIAKVIYPLYYKHLVYVLAHEMGFGVQLKK